MTSFPQYRMLGEQLVIYKITDFVTFEELQKFGARYRYQRISAQVYPEKLRILDMLESNPPFQKANEMIWREAFQRYTDLC